MRASAVVSWLLTTRGDDWLLGGQGNDLIVARTGDVILNGNLGNDTVTAGVGNDFVRGGQGNDILQAASGNDHLYGDRGDDTLTGGSGADVVHVSVNGGLDRITDFNGAQGDRIQLDAGATYTLAQVGSDTVLSLSSGDQLTLIGVQRASVLTDWIALG